MINYPILVGQEKTPLLTLDSAVQIALKQSDKVKIALDEAKAAAANEKFARNAFLPSVNLSGTATALDRPINVSFGGNAVTISQQYQTSGKIGLDLPIDISGTLRKQLDQNNLETIAAGLNVAAVENDLVREVHQVFYQTLQTKELIKVAQSNLENAQAREKTVSLLLGQGLSTQFDLLRAQTTVADSEQKLRAAQNNYDISKANLNQVLEQPASTNIEVSDTMPTIPSMDFTNLEAKAIAQRPEVLRASEDILANTVGVSLASAGNRPTMDFTLGASYIGRPAAIDPVNPVGSAALSINIPLFDKGDSKAKTDLAKANLQQSKDIFSQVKDTVSFQVREALLNFQSDSDRMKVAEAALKEAQEQYRLSVVRQEQGVTRGGVSPLLELSDSQNALTQAETNVVNARYETAIAESSLEAAVGNYVVSK